MKREGSAETQAATHQSLDGYKLSGSFNQNIH